MNCQYANDYKLHFPIGDGGQAKYFFLINLVSILELKNIKYMP